ncbi:serine/threonine protein kinase [Alteromonas lipolytica]|uniref:serine/threonine protein kinase n=1 Tax=Alteromonas lipolytica TaxID=1856405 RepID=UPI0015869081|nr:serine/threonine protein kinase [Alteromonas lipolytica]GGF63608.1 serine/threonine protein kinase [Alteromonas lipolytica]
MQVVIDSLCAAIPGHEFSPACLQVLHQGRFANAVVYLYQDAQYCLVIKDFSSRHWLVRKTIGRLSVNQEYKTISQLKHIDGITPDCYRLSDCSIAYQHIAGQTLSHFAKNGDKLEPAFFYQLENTIKAMHDNGRVHLDLRNMGNILVDENGNPALIDFQSSIQWRRFPQWLQKFMRYADITGAYKAWDRYGTTPLPAHKKRFLTRYNKTRKLWVFKGYPIHRMQVRLQGLAANVMALDIVRNLMDKF